MTTSVPIKAQRDSLAGGFSNAARSYLWGRRGFLILAIVALVAGAGFNWNWLVAAGIAPVLIGVLPCLVMCGLGLCMNRLFGGSCEKQSASPRDAGDPAQPAAALSAAKPDRPSVAASCCGVVGDTPAPQVQSLEERRKSHA